MYLVLELAVWPSHSRVWATELSRCVDCCMYADFSVFRSFWYRESTHHLYIPFRLTHPGIRLLRYSGEYREWKNF